MTPSPVLRLFYAAFSVFVASGCDPANLGASSSQTPSREIGKLGLTWEEFKASTYREPETGIFIVDGDTPIENEKQLREFYELHVADGKLTVHRAGGVDAKWDDSRKLNLSYCVSTHFGPRHATVVASMRDAAAAWAAAANVRFVHVTSEDGACGGDNTRVLFDVRPASTGKYLARAFFPFNARPYRNIFIDDSVFRSSNATLTGILRHELGHSLGFRHEHIRPEAGTCLEDGNWRPVTAYDRASVMHYPQCNGINSWALELTDVDKDGAAAIYGPPGSTTPQPGSTGVIRSEQFTGAVAQGESNQFGPFSVEAGTLLQVTMTGSGDPDLYVRFGAQPTKTLYNCRPYADGAAESCRLTVPREQTSAYVVVDGYAAGSFDIEVRYTKSGAGSTLTLGPGANASFEAHVLTLVNQKRSQGARCGETSYGPKPMLVMDANLRTSARLHSEDMATKNYFSDTSQGGTTALQRIQTAGYSGSPIGENIAAGFATPTQVVAAWMNSPAHCHNIMSDSYTSVGVGYGYSADSSYGHYWTQDFGGR